VSRVTELQKFSDSRGWSLMDMYGMIPEPQYTTTFSSTTEGMIRQTLDIPLTSGANPSGMQINYSVLYPGIVKAWHRHKYQDDYFCIIKGMAQVGVYTDENGPEKYFIGEHNPSVVHIRAGEWHGLTCIGNEPCGLLYFVTNRYNHVRPDEERAGAFEFVDREWWLPENK